MLGVFCMQAEEGIRDLGRSRGLGDVYKRQAESGISERQQVIELEAGNVDAILIGETMMISPDKKGMLDRLRGIG